jgi:DNA-binding response OmpR family regulator
MDTPLLLVEDDTNVARTLTGRLASEGFGVTHAGSVAEAKSAIAQQRFVAAILDVGLPDGNGFEVARHLGEHSPQTAMLFLTAYGTPEDRIHGLELGADDYMTKPFAFRELVLRVQNMLKRARDISQSTAAPAGPVRMHNAGGISRASPRTAESLHRLTHKECAVLQLLLEKSRPSAGTDPLARLAPGRIPHRENRGLQFHPAPAPPGGAGPPIPNHPQHPRRGAAENNE